MADRIPTFEDEVRRVRVVSVLARYAASRLAEAPVAVTLVEVS